MRVKYNIYVALTTRVKSWNEFFFCFFLLCCVDTVCGLGVHIFGIQRFEVYKYTNLGYILALLVSYIDKVLYY